jgi:hypothetical protein
LGTTHFDDASCAEKGKWKPVVGFGVGNEQVTGGLFDGKISVIGMVSACLSLFHEQVSLCGQEDELAVYNLKNAKLVE